MHDLTYLSRNKLFSFENLQICLNPCKSIGQCNFEQNSFLCKIHILSGAEIVYFSYSLYLNNGVIKTPKRRIFLSLVFACYE